jgi:glycosyltransferase involved in cell wall biosynthesis
MTAPVTVAVIITKLELGGAQRGVLALVSQLDRARFRPVLITGEPGALDEEARALPGVACYQIPSLVRPIHPLADLRALMALTRLLKQLEPVIVHTHSSKAGILGRLAAWLAGVPIIVHTIHGFGFTRYQHRLLRTVLIVVERVVSRFTTRVFSVSEANRRDGIGLGLFPANRCTVVRCGVDLEAFRRARVDVMAKRRELGVDPQRPLIGMVAPMKPQKAPLDFVRMAARVREARPDARFVFVGDGELRDAMETEIRRLGLTEWLRLTGWRRDVPELLRCLDLFVLTSLWEGLPCVYLEALSSGVPVVGTRVDGAEEVVKDGLTGYLVPPGDVSALADRVLALLADPEMARRMGRNGTALPREFDVHDMVRRHEEEYDRLLAEQAGLSRLSRLSGLSGSCIREGHAK